MHVYLVGQMQIVPSQMETFLQSQETNWRSDAQHDGDKCVETAGRICYLSWDNPRPGGWIAYRDNILKSRHGSVVEHSVFAFVIDGVSRALSHELVRHRTGVSFSQLSQRYVPIDKMKFVDPPLELTENERSYFESMKRVSVTYYKEIVTKLEDRLSKQFGKSTFLTKTIRQTARYLLPNMTATTLYMTINARELRFLIELRGSIHADAEIRELSNMLLAAVKPYSTLFDDMTTVDDAITTGYSKV